MPILLVPGNYLHVLDSVQEDGVRETTLGELFPEFGARDLCMAEVVHDDTGTIEL
jgi:hypothetical protein